MNGVYYTAELNVKKKKISLNSNKLICQKLFHVMSLKSLRNFAYVLYKKKIEGLKEHLFFVVVVFIF